MNTRTFTFIDEAATFVEADFAALELKVIASLNLPPDSSIDQNYSRMVNIMFMRNRLRPRQLALNLKINEDYLRQILGIYDHLKGDKRV